MEIEIVENTSPVNIKVIGIGGGGCNTINRMLIDRVKEIEFIAINTDSQSLKRSKADHVIQIGKNLTKGQGAGADPKIGEQSAEEEYETIKKTLAGADMVFITSGMGGGTGTGATPIVAKIAKEVGALTVAVVSKPFTYEMRMEQAEIGINNLREHTDTLVIIPNDYLANYTDEKLTIKNAFYLADSVLTQGIRGISDIVLSCGDINVDFADVKAVMNRRGGAIMSTVTISETEDISQIIDNITKNSLIENGGVIEKATGLLVNIEHGSETTLEFINQLNEAITNKLTTADPKIIFGFMENKSLSGEVKITLIATGITDESTLQKSTAKFIKKENDIDDIEKTTDSFNEETNRFSTTAADVSNEIDTEQLFKEIEEETTSNHFGERPESHHNSIAKNEKVAQEESMHVLAVDQIAGYSQATKHISSNKDNASQSFNKDEWEAIETPAYLRKRMKNNNTE